MSSKNSIKQEPRIKMTRVKDKMSENDVIDGVINQNPRRKCKNHY